MTMPNPGNPRDRNARDEVATRQGTKQRMNVRVLATSLVLIAIIFAGLYFLFLAAPHSENRGTAPDQTTEQPLSPPAVPTPQPAPPTPQ